MGMKNKHIKSNTVVLGNLNTLLSQKNADRLQKVNSKIELIQTLERMELVDVYRVFHPTSSAYTFSAAAHRAFSKIDHILTHRTCLSKCEDTEIVPYTLSDHSAMKFEIIGLRIHKNFINMEIAPS